MLVGITGNIGSGKSTVTNILRLKGYKCINGDLFAKGFLKRKEVKERIKQVFGREVFEGSEVSFKKLGEKVFKKSEELKKLTSITSPLVLETLKKVKKFTENKLVFFEGAVIVEQNWKEVFDALVFVYAPLGVRLKRAYPKFRKKSFFERERHQFSCRKKLAFSDYLICNTSHLLNLKEQVNLLVENLTGGKDEKD